MLTDAFTIRRLRPDEAAVLKAVRLRALQSDPAAFGSTYAREAAFDDAEWTKRLANPDVPVFIVSDVDGEIVGMSGAQFEASIEDVIFWGVWVDAAHRKKGVSGKLYAEMLAWAKTKTGAKRAIVSRRGGNEASHASILAQGFIQTGIDPEKIWADGVKEPQVFYARELS